MNAVGLAVTAVTVGLFGAAIVHRTYAMMVTTTSTTNDRNTNNSKNSNLSDSIQQSLPQLYDTTSLKRIIDYTINPITNSVTANVDETETLTLRNAVVLQQQQAEEKSLPSVCFVIRRPG